MGVDSKDIRIRIIAEAMTGDAEAGLQKLAALEDVMRKSTDEAGAARVKASGQEIASIESLKATLDELKKKRDAATNIDDVRAYNSAIVDTENKVSFLSKTYAEQGGILEGLKNKLMDLRMARDKVTNVTEFNELNAKIKSTDDEIAKLEGTTKKTGSAFQSMAMYIGAAFAIDSVIGFGKGIFEDQSKVENFGLIMKKVAGEESAKKIEADLKKMLLDTPLTFENATKNIQNLTFTYKQQGVELKYLVKDYEAIGNVARGNEDTLNRLILVYGQVASANKLMGNDVRQFTEAQVPIIQLLGQSMGKTTAQITEMVTAGEIGFAEVRKALVDAGSAGGLFAGQMAITMNTVMGKASNLKDSMFYAMSYIGNYFADNAKNAVLWATNLVSSFFGTQEATNASVKVVKDAISTWLAYEAVTKAVVLAEAGLGIVMKVQKLLIGERLVLQGLLTGEVVATTEAELEATIAAEAFNTTLAANPIGLVILAIGSLITGIELYKTVGQATKQQQDALNKSMAEAITPLELSKVKFNELASTVLSAKASVEEKTKALQHLKEEFPDQMKGIGNLENAERNLSKVIRDTNNDFVVRARLLENEVRIKYNTAIAEKAIAEKIALENDLKNAGTNTTTLVTDMTGRATVYDSEATSIKKMMAEKDKAIQQATKYNQNIAEQSAKITKQLVFDYETQGAAKKKTTDDEGEEDGKKEKYHNDELLRVENEAKKSEESALRILEADKFKTEQMLINAKASGASETELILIKEEGYKKEIEDIKTLSETKTAQLEAEKKVAIDKATFEKKTAEEIATIRIDFDNKIAKSEDDYTKKSLDLKDKIIEGEQKITDTNEKEVVKRMKANNDYVKQMLKDYDTLEKEEIKYRKAEADFEEAREKLRLEKLKNAELASAKSEEERMVILKKYAVLEFDIEKKKLEDQISFNEKQMEDINKNSTLTINQKLAKNLRILTENTKLKTQLVNLEEKQASEILKIDKSTSEYQVEIKKRAIQTISDLTANFSSSLVTMLENTNNEELKGMAKTVTLVGNGLKTLTGDYQKNMEERAKLIKEGYSSEQATSKANMGSELAIIQQFTDMALQAYSQYYANKAAKQKADLNNAITAQEAADKKLLTDMQTTYDAEQLARELAYDKEIGAAYDKEAEKLKALAGGNAQALALVEAAAKKEADIRALYNESMNSSDATRAAQAKALVEAQVNDVKNALNDQLSTLINNSDLTKGVQQDTANVLSGIDTKYNADKYNAETNYLEKKKKAEDAAAIAKWQLEVKEFEVDKANQLAQAKINILSMAVKFGILGAIAGLITGKEITDAINSEQPPPRPFAKGTEYVQLGKSPRGVDTVPALLTEGERVMTVEQNKALGNISNKELVWKVKNFEAIVNRPEPDYLTELRQMPMLKIPDAKDMVNKRDVEYLLNMNLEPLRKEMAGLKEAFLSRPESHAIIDENGLNVVIKKGNAKEKLMTSRFRG